MTSKVKKGIVIFDLDGCVSDDEWRRKFIDFSGEVTNYDKYHQLISADQIYPAALDLLKIYAQDYHITFITARPIKHNIMTRDWINGNTGLKPLDDYWLYMRPHGDERASPELKKHIVELMRMDDTTLKFVMAFDDREDVVKAYHSIGIPARVFDGRTVKDVSTKFSGNGVHIEYLGGGGSSVAATFNPHGTMTHEQWTGIKKAMQYLKDPETEGAKQMEEAGVASIKDAAGLKRIDAAEILAAAADTFRERNAKYKDNYQKVGAVMAALFPDGVQLRTADDHNFYHLFELMIVKLTRFVNSGLTHADSIHDLAVYAAMCESLSNQHQITLSATEVNNGVVC